jgi:diacylglycerol kinase family enzyme
VSRGRRDLALVLNPAATRVRRTLRSEASRLLADHGLSEVLVSRGPGEAGELAARAVAGGAEIVVAMGGDGTLNEVAAALAGGAVPIAPLPAGGANVFARALGWPAEPEAALLALDAALARPRTRPLVLGRLRAGPNERIVCMNAGIALDGEVVAMVEANQRAKHAMREVAYAIATTVATARLARAPAALEAVVEDGPPRRLAALLAGVGAPYAYLGDRPLDALPHVGWDGRLAWLGLARVRVGQVAVMTLGALRGGRHLDRPEALHGRARGPIRVVADPAAAVQVDGEPLGWHPEVELAAGPTLGVVVPRTPPQVGSPPAEANGAPT